MLHVVLSSLGTNREQPVIEGFNVNAVQNDQSTFQAGHTYSYGHITVEYARPVSVSVNTLTTHVISYLTVSSHALADPNLTRMVSDHVSVSVETLMTVVNGSLQQSLECPNITSWNGSNQS